ncbi:hypothetical protein KKG82_00765, partial [Patescibacteria group bacterium]|nr:hypothetical protein [Patescibacteria group bacterium]
DLPLNVGTPNLFGSDTFFKKTAAPSLNWLTAKEISELFEKPVKIIKLKVHKDITELMNER